MDKTPSKDGLANLKAFVEKFRKTRKSLDKTQHDVAEDIAKLKQDNFSQTMVSRFEQLDLSYANMASLKPFFEHWIELNLNLSSSHPQQHTSSSSANKCQVLSNPTKERKRKRRTSFKHSELEQLEREFLRTKSPTNETIARLSFKLKMSKKRIQTWFSNRRQKYNKIVPPVQYSINMINQPADTNTCEAESTGEEATNMYPKKEPLLQSPLNTKIQGEGEEEVKSEEGQDDEQEAFFVDPFFNNQVSFEWTGKEQDGTVIKYQI